MKFKVETTIPLRQYENMKTSYECEHTEKDKAIQMAIDDLKKYHNFIQKNTPEAFYKPKEGEIVICGNFKYTFLDGQWDWKEIKKGE